MLPIQGEYLSSYQEVSVCPVVLTHLLRFGSLPHSARHLCPGNAHPPCLLDRSNAAGLFYSWRIRYQSPILPLWWGSAGVLSTSGRIGFLRRGSPDWQTNKDGADAEDRTHLTCWIRRSRMEGNTLRPCADTGDDRM